MSSTLCPLSPTVLFLENFRFTPLAVADLTSKTLPVLIGTFRFQLEPRGNRDRIRNMLKTRARETETDPGRKRNIERVSIREQVCAEYMYKKTGKE